MIKVENLYKSYNDEPCLRGVSFYVAPGEFVSLMGDSGSGKTTLLETLVGLRIPDSGSVIVGGEDVFSLRDRRLAEFRHTTIGVVYQSFGLIPTISAEENILLPMLLRHEGGAACHEMVHYVAEELGITGTLKKRPCELSGGQQQRVAIARASVYRPRLLLLDEPTGSLDSENTARVLEFLKKYRAEFGTTIFQITHNAATAEGSRLLHIRDGVVTN